MALTLPVVVLAAGLGARMGSPKGLVLLGGFTFLEWQIARLGEAAGDRAFGAWQQRLLKEPGVILLDGLDEVPEAQRRRQVLLQAIQILSGIRGSTVISLITAGAVRVTQLAPSLVVTYKVEPLDA